RAIPLASTRFASGSRRYASSAPSTSTCTTKLIGASSQTTPTTTAASTRSLIQRGIGFIVALGVHRHAERAEVLLQHLEPLVGVEEPAPEALRERQEQLYAETRRPLNEVVELGLEEPVQDGRRHGDGPRRRSEERRVGKEWR